MVKLVPISQPLLSLSLSLSLLSLSKINHVSVVGVALWLGARPLTAWRAMLAHLWVVHLRVDGARGTDRQQLLSQQWLRERRGHAGLGCLTGAARRPWAGCLRHAEGDLQCLELPQRESRNNTEVPLREEFFYFSRGVLRWGPPSFVEG